VVLGSFVAVFPGVLEKIFGVPYNFEDNWGVSRAKFEIYTLATLGIILAIALVGYLAGASVRREIVEAEIGGPEPTVLPDDLPPAVA
jgi:hypothetical protein